MVDPSSPNPQSRKSKPPRSLRSRALAALARREYSRRELEAKLRPFTENPAEIPELLDDFERRGWLSEARVVEQVLASRRRRFGAQRITHELRGKGISEGAIGAARENLQDSEIAAARGVWQRKFKTAPTTAQERARHMRFLQGRGFSVDVIRKVVSGHLDDEADDNSGDNADE
ncbi:MAG: regulatory protein RecX [Betaproteobacteria bacterium]|nr:regulatory protein RecX [Betaproteobacteria bacterium]